MDMKPSEMSSSKMFGGYNKRYKHYSPTLGCSMTFHIYFPPPTPNKFPLDRVLIGLNKTVPRIPKYPNMSINMGRRILYFLSGLTCTDENFIAKSGAQRVASSVGIALVVPDTSPSISQIVVKTQYDDQEENDHTNSPLTKNCLLSFIVQAIWRRNLLMSLFCVQTCFLTLFPVVAGGLNIEGEADSWDFGVGAGFYLNATQEKWKNWRMYDYVVKELPQLLRENFPQLETSQASISGYAQFVILRARYANSNGSLLPALHFPNDIYTNFLQEYDATHLVSKFNNVSATILIDQGRMISS
ncbi:hypothetical protein Leryth_013528 [Lithospermum erythrorhizon]|nr:hypothetical protein Leryth_013528 [Lithospermum erythrorhizon]